MTGSLTAAGSAGSAEAFARGPGRGKRLHLAAVGCLKRAEGGLRPSTGAGLLRRGTEPMTLRTPSPTPPNGTTRYTSRQTSAAAPTARRLRWQQLTAPPALRDICDKITASASCIFGHLTDLLRHVPNRMGSACWFVICALGLPTDSLRLMYRSSGAPKAVSRRGFCSGYLLHLPLSIPQRLAQRTNGDKCSGEMLLSASRSLRQARASPRTSVHRKTGVRSCQHLA